MDKDLSLDEMRESLKYKQDSFLVGFLAGAFGSCIAEFFTLPLDTAKVRMMLYGMKGPYRSVPSTLHYIYKQQGFTRLWNGFTPNCARQFVFSGVKLSIYEPIRNTMCKTDQEKLQTPLIKQIVAGVSSGAIACAVS